MAGFYGLGHQFFPYLSLLYHCLDAIGYFFAVLHKNPPLPAGLHEQFALALVGEVALEIVDVDSLGQAVCDHFEVRVEALALDVAGIAVEPHADVRLLDEFHDRRHRGQFAGRTVSLDVDLLAQLGCVGADLVGGPGDLRDGLLAGYVLVERIRKDSQRAAADVVAEFEMGVCGFYGFL